MTCEVLFGIMLACDVGFVDIWMQEFVDVAEGLDLSVELRHKKINISNPRVCIPLSLRPLHVFLQC